MKRCLIVLLALVPGLALAGERVVLEKVTLQPQERRSVSIDAAKKTKLGWDHTDSKASDRCKKNCVMMYQHDSKAGYAQAFGGAMRISPQNGKVAATFENVEDFPLEIEIYKMELP